MATISETTTKVQDSVKESASKVQGTVKESATKVQGTVKEYAAKADLSKVQDSVKDLAAKADVSKAQDTVFEYLNKAEDFVVSGVRTAAEKTEGYVPEVTVPAEVPTGEAVVEHGFGFFQRLLDNQHDFAKALLQASAPVRSKVQRPVTAPAPKAKKAAAKAA